MEDMHTTSHFPPKSIAMKFTIISQNLQGMNDDAFVGLVRNYYRNYFRDIEALCIQEHKLRRIKLQALRNKIWRDAIFFAKEVDAAYNNDPNGWSKKWRHVYVDFG